jgi:hypothetical protein
MDAAARGAFLSLTLPAAIALVEKIMFRPTREVKVCINLRR